MDLEENKRIIEQHKLLTEDWFNVTYEIKLKNFKQNLVYLFENSTFISQIIEQNFENVFELLKNDNLLVTPLPVFRYYEKVFGMSNGEKTHTFDDGKYDEITVDEIKKRLDDKYIVFIYNMVDGKYDNVNSFKFRTVTLNKSCKNLTSEQVIEFCDEMIINLKQNNEDDKLNSYLCLGLINYLEKHKLWVGVCSDDDKNLFKYIPEFTKENAIKHANANDFNNSSLWWNGNNNSYGFDVNNRIIFLEWIKSQYINNNNIK